MIVQVSDQKVIIITHHQTRKWKYRINVSTSLERQPWEQVSTLAQGREVTGLSERCFYLSTLNIKKSHPQIYIIIILYSLNLLTGDWERVWEIVVWSLIMIHLDVKQNISKEEIKVVIHT